MPFRQSHNARGSGEPRPSIFPACPRTCLTLATLLFSLLATFLTADAAEESSPDAAFAAAVRDFENGDLESARDGFRALADAGHVAGDLFFNLGATAHRLDRPGEAMLWFRRALLADGHMPEARQSAEHLRSRIGPLEFATTPFQSFLRRIPDAWLTWFATLAGWAFPFALAGALLFAPSRPRRAWMTVLAIAALLLAIAAFWGRSHRRAHLAAENFATVTAPEAAALAAPVPGAKEVIALPPGSEVRIVQQSGPWIYADIPGDLRGWIEAESIEALWPLP